MEEGPSDRKTRTEELVKRMNPIDRVKKFGLTTPGGGNMLHMAAGGMTIGHCEVYLKTMGPMGCTINGLDFKGRTPLFYAITGGKLENARFLVENGADLNWSADNGERPLHLAVNTGAKEVLELLVSKGADVNGVDKSGRTPLFVAIFARNHEATRFLVENGADVNWIAFNGERPLHFAANRGSKKMAEVLITKGADIHANSPRGTPLHYAAASRNCEVLEYLLDVKADPNGVNSSVDASPIFKALMAKEVSVECLELLVKAGADSNKPSYLATPLKYAATECDEGPIICLLQSGADPDMLDIMGLKPIENAACKGRRDVVELLFPLTSRVEFYPDWSVNGLMLHAKSREEKVKSKSKLKEINMLAKAKGDDAFERENYFDAATWYKKAFEVDPNDAEVLSNRSLCFARMNNGTKALKYAKACIGLKSDWAMAHYRLGEAWKILEDYEKAANAFSKALAVEPDNEMIIEELSAVRAKASELEEQMNEDARAAKAEGEQCAVM